MSASGPAGRTARWSSADPGEWAIRALQTVLASLAVLAVLAVPAWAGASFSGGTELQANEPARLELLVTEEDRLGGTVQVAVAVPTGFEALGCTAVGWDCGPPEDGRLVFTRNVVGTFVSSSLYLDVRAGAVNGTHPFRVVQSNGEDEMVFRPAVTVVGGEDPAPRPTPSPTPAPSPAGREPDATASPGPAPSPSPASSSGSATTDAADGAGGEDRADDAADGRDGDEGGSSGGSTAPRRTQGRSTGTTLEVTPGEAASQEQPDVVAPDVADGPAVARPDDGGGRGDVADEDTATVAAADGGPTDGGTGGDVPWQQWVGGALLLLGAAVLLVRQRGPELARAGVRIAGRARGLGAAVGRLPGPWRG